MVADLCNRRVYSDPSVVRWYAEQDALQPAEAVLFEALHDELPRLSVLDVGVGGGRTTKHLARAARYVGIDYSKPMVEAVRRRYPECELLDADAREMSFPDASFDLVVFSHNGIDYVDHDGRLAIFAEIGRVLRPGGRFIFSTHHLDRDDLQFEAPPGEPMWKRTLCAVARARLRKANPEYTGYTNRDHVFMNDGAFRWRGRTYHVRLAAQIAQLHAAGFATKRILGGRDGRAVDVGDRPGDPWLYFLAVRLDRSS